MTHEQAYERLPELVELRLAGTDMALRAHLAECPICQARLRNLERVAHSLRTVALDVVDPPSGLEERVLAIPAAEPRRPQGRLRRRLLPAGVGIAAAASLAALAITLARPDTPPPVSVALEAEQTVTLRPVTGEVHGTVTFGRPSGSTRVVRLDVRELPMSDSQSFDLWFVSETGAMRAGSFGPDDDGRCIVDLTTPAGERFDRIVITPAGSGPREKVIATS